MDFKGNEVPVPVLVAAFVLGIWIGAQLGGGVCGRPVTIPMLFEQLWISLLGAPQDE